MSNEGGESIELGGDALGSTKPVERARRQEDAGRKWANAKQNHVFSSSSTASFVMCKFTLFAVVDSQ